MGEQACRAGLRIGLVANGWPPEVGGVPHQVELLATELFHAGHRPSVLALSGARDRGPGEAWTEAGYPFPVHRLRADYGRERSLADGLRNPVADGEIRRWVGVTHPDLVHVHHLTGFGLGCLSVLDDLGVPSVLSLHDYWLLCPRGQMWHLDGHACAAVEKDICAACLARTWPHLTPTSADVAQRLHGVRAMLARPAALLTPSRRAAAVFEAWGLDAERLQVIPGAVAHPGTPPGDVGSQGSSGGATRLGVLGSTQTSKGVLFLAEVLAASPELMVELHVHGPLVSDHGNTDGLSRLEALAASDRRIHLHGPYGAADLDRVLAGLDVVAAPALWEETFGLTVREARAAGLPVLVSDRGALAEGLAAGEHLSVLPAGDLATWTRVLGRLRPLGRKADPGVAGAAEFAGAHLEVYGRVLAS